jgi:mercuric ion transport protein
MTSPKISKEALATTGVIGAALLAASCCLAPALFILFGISASALTQLGVLEPYRPAFIAAGGLCLAAAGWWIYGRRERAAEACGDDQCAVDSPRQRRTRLLFWISAAAFAVAVIYPYALSLYLSHGGS